MLKLGDKEFKVTMLTVLENLKGNMNTISEEMGNFSSDTETQKE